MPARGGKKKSRPVLDFSDLAGKESTKEGKKPYMQEKEDSKRLQQKERGNELPSPNEEI